MSTVKVSNIQHGSAASAAITLDANGQATLNGLAFPTSGSLSGRNRIINGDMRIDQRNAGAVFNLPPNQGYSLDRWTTWLSQNTYSVQRNAGSVTPPAGFSNYLGVTVTSATTIGVSDYFGVGQKIEGYNMSDLNWGTASAQSATLSFWVRSSLTGNFGAVIRRGDGGQYYAFTYAISAANTWEYKTVTVPGPTSGTWDSTNGTGLFLLFGLGAGSNQTASSNNTWINGGVLGASGATAVVATNGATFYITGVQLEAGTVATPFERRSYGQELALCQRYFQYFPAGAIGRWTNATVCELGGSYPVAMRTTPTVSINPNDAVCNIFRMGIAVNQCTVSSVSSTFLNASGGVVSVGVSSTGSTPVNGDMAAYDPDSDSHVFFLTSEL